MNPTSSPNNDGFTVYFYLSCWDTIKDNMCAFVTNSLQGGYIPRNINFTILVLIPKIPEARSIIGQCA